MLTISKPLSSSQAQTYHAKEFMSAEQNYWKQGDTILGEWQGRMAERYGLSGAIDKAHFARLSDGQNPLTGEQLVRHRNGQEYTTANGTTVKPVEHRAGWDATFSAPKSVSLTALVGGDDRVREAHRQAVTTALRELERYTQARIGGNHAAETTGKFVVAKFEHDTARPVDGYAAPQLHTHAVIFNMTERADGSTRAIQPQSYFDSQQFATAVYQSELMYRLSRLGYEITTGRSGAPEIKGYSQEYLDASSPRSQQIREYLEKSGFAGPEAAQIAAHSTRDKKEIHTPSEVVAAHRQVAAEFGNQADRVVVEARARASAQEQAHVPNNPSRVQEAVTFAKSRNFEREAVTDERDIMRDALRRGMGDLIYSQVRDNFEQRQATGEFQRAPGQKHDTGRQFTTRDAIAEELATIKHMQQGQSVVEPIMRQDDAAAYARTREFLNPSQQKVVEEVLASHDRIHGLQGTAGTVVSTDPKANQLTVERDDGQQVTYDPKRLHGIAAYREISRDFSEGDRLQFTVSKPDMDIKNRDLGTVERIDGTNMTVRMDGDKPRTLTFDASEMRHFDHGYTVTSHSSQGLTTNRVLVNMDTTAHPELINTRFAYVSVSRASEDARIYTNNAATLAERLSTDISKASAVEVARPKSETQAHQPQSKEQTMTNTKELTPEEQRRQFQQEAHDPATDKAQSPSEIDQRHYAPLHNALPTEAAGYDWKRETGDIQSYQNNQTAGWLHIDPQGQFYDRQAQPIAKENALEHAGHLAVAVNEISQAQSVAKGASSTDQELSL